MPRRYVNDLGDGDSVEEVYLLADKQLRANRNAQLYLLASLRDRTGVVNGLMWNITEDQVAHVNAGDFVRIRGKVQLYQGSLQMIVAQIQKVAGEGLDLEDFRPTTIKDVDRLVSR